jgi:membrane-bound lytic murein transglycosylase D
MAYAHELGIEPKPSLLSYYETDTVLVKHTLTFEQIQRFVNIDEETLEAYNPSYKYKIIPKLEKRPYYLVLPREFMGGFVANEDSIYAKAKKEVEEKKAKLPTYAEMDEKIRHKVRSGETLGGIAQKYGVRVSDIKRWNGLRSDRIRVGQRLTIFPRRLPKSSTASKSSKKKKSSKPVPAPAGSKTITYTVQSGDTLYDIAKKYPGISAENIKEWNQIGSSIKPGMKLVIHTQ